MEYNEWKGQRVQKTAFKKNKGSQPKPFKSGFLTNTVKDITTHPILNIPAFTFEEDESYVECRRCELVNNN